MAESLAHLIDGYQMILSQQRSVWINHDLRNPSESELLNKSDAEIQRKKSETLSPLVRRRCVVPSAEAHNDVESASLGELCSIS
jgi:hypothetical protein